MTERVLYRDEQAYKNMQAVAGVLTINSPKGYYYRVKNVYLDFGQDWMWTTICREGEHACQILSPRQWKMIVEADDPMSRLNCVVDLIHGDYWCDK